MKIIKIETTLSLIWTLFTIITNFNKINYLHYFSMMMVKVPIWQFSPSQPSAQIHWYVPGRLLHVEPCWQGYIKHSFSSTIKNNKFFDIHAHVVFFTTLVILQIKSRGESEKGSSASFLINTQTFFAPTHRNTSNQFW